MHCNQGWTDRFMGQRSIRWTGHFHYVNVFDTNKLSFIFCNMLSQSIYLSYFSFTSIKPVLLKLFIKDVEVEEIYNRNMQETNNLQSCLEANL